MPRILVLCSITMFIIAMTGISFAIDTSQALSHATLYIPAVEKTDSGDKGSLATLDIFLMKGNGHVFVDTLPLTEIDTQAGARIAKEAVEETLNTNLDKYDIFFVIRSNAPTVSGPSAGGAMATGLLAMMFNLSIDNTVIMTGTSSPDGSVGHVGGIMEKAQAVAEGGGKLFLIPKGQSIISVSSSNDTTNSTSGMQVTDKVDIRQYAMKKWNLTVLEVSDIKQAMRYMTGYAITQNVPYLNRSPELDSAMKTMTEGFIRDDEAIVSEIEAGLLLPSIPKDKVKEINASLSGQKSRLADASKAFENGDYYTASSFCFVSEIELVSINNTIGYLKSLNKTDFIRNLISDADTRINSSAKKLELQKQDMHGITDIEVILLSAERLEEAKDYLASGQLRFYMENYEASIFPISYAEVRSDTVDRWLGVSDYFHGNNMNFDFQKLGSLTRLRLVDTISLSTYANLIGINTSSLDGDIDKARKNYNAGDYEAALFSTVATKAAIDAQMKIIDTDFNDTAALNETFRTLEDNALRDIRAAQDSGITPIMALNYYEYGKYFENVTPEIAINYLVYSKHFAGISKNIAEVMQGRDFTPETGIVSISQKDDLPKYITGIFIIAALFMGFIIGLSVSKEKKPAKLPARKKRK